MLLPHLSVSLLQAANNSHLVVLTKDEYVGNGFDRVMRRDVIQLFLSGYYLPKSAFGVLDAGILNNMSQQNPRPGRKSSPI